MVSSSLEEFDTLVIGAVGDPPDGGNSHIQLGARSAAELGFMGPS